MTKQFTIQQTLSTRPVQTEVWNHTSTVEYHKMRLRTVVVQNIKSRGWTQKEAAKYFGVSQSSVSYICSGKTRNFSMDTLLKMLSALGYKYTVNIG